MLIRGICFKDSCKIISNLLFGYLFSLGDFWKSRPEQTQADAKQHTQSTRWDSGPSKRKRKPLTQEQKDAHNKPFVGMNIDTQPTVADEHVNEGLQSRKRKALTLDQKNDYNKRRRVKSSMAMASKTRVATAVEAIHSEETNINRRRTKRLMASRIIATAAHKRSPKSRKRKALTLDQKNDYNKRRRAKRSMGMVSKTRVATAVEEPIHFEETNINRRRRIRRKQKEKVKGPLDIGIPLFECPL
ncbi:hypothetical protein AKJ16_DCAP25576 [Drosera capensis]